VSGVEADASGNIYATDEHYPNLDRVQKFSSTGAFLQTWAQPGRRPAAAPSGHIYTADVFEDRVQEFTSTGTFVKTFGRFGNTNCCFATPTDVTTDSAGYIYVVDAGNYRVQKFRPGATTSWVPTLGTTSISGTADGQFDNPDGVAVDRFGNVYAADTYNERIQKFKPVP
jgi:hypothetical protein